MDLDNYNALSIDLAEELGEECTLLSLPIRSDFHKVALSLISHIGLRDEKNKSLAIPVRTDETGSYCDDYYCRKFMRLTKSDGHKYNIFSELMTSFDELLEYDHWRRIGTENRHFTEAQAEIFICCSAFAHDRSLKQHLAVFLQYCRREGIALNSVEPFRLEIGRLISEELEKFTYDNKSHKKSNEPNGSFFNEQRLENHISNQEQELVKSEIGNIRKFLDVYPYNKITIRNPHKNRLQKSLHDIDKLLLTIPDNVDLLAMKCALLNGLGLRDSALTIAENIYEKSSGHEAVVGAYSNLLIHFNSREKALYICEKYISEFPFSVLMKAKTANLYQYFGRIWEAIDLYKEVISVDEGFLRPYLELADCYFEIREYEKAETILNSAYRLYPEVLEIQTRLAACLSMLRKNKELKELSNKIFNSDNNYFDKDLYKGFIYCENKNYTAARKISKAWVEKVIKNPLSKKSDIAFSFSMLSAVVDHSDTSKETLDFSEYCLIEGLKADPDNSAILADLAVLDFKRDKISSARNRFLSYKNTVESERKIRDFCFNVSFKGLSFSHRVIPLEWLLIEQPKHSKTYIDLAKIYLDDGDKESASKHLHLTKQIYFELYNDACKSESVCRSAFDFAKIFLSFSEKYPENFDFIDLSINICDEIITLDLPNINYDLKVDILEVKTNGLALKADQNNDSSSILAALNSSQNHIDSISKYVFSDRWRAAEFQKAKLYYNLFSVSDDRKDLNQSIAILKGIEAFESGEYDNPLSLNKGFFFFYVKAFCSLRDTARVAGDADALLEAYEGFRQCIQYADKFHNFEGWAKASFELANTLFDDLHELDRNAGFIYEAEKFYSDVIASPAHQLHSSALHGLADILYELYRNSNNEEKIIEAISLFDKSLDLAQQEKADCMLGYYLKRKGSLQRQLGCITSDTGYFYNSVDTFEKAMNLYIDSEDTLSKRICYNNLGLSMGCIYEYSKQRDVEVVEESISNFKAALELIPEDDVTSIAWCHKHLGLSYLNLAKRLGDQKNYAEAFKYYSSCKLANDNNDPVLQAETEEALIEISERIESLSKA